MTVFDYTDYKLFMNDWISTQPSNGHGQLRKIAISLKLNSVVMSQVFRGDRELTPEQAVQVARYVGIDEKMRDYFILLVQFARAGTHELKSILQSQIDAQQHSARSLKNRIKHEKFSEKDKAIFYSQWYFSAIRLGVSVKKFSNEVAIATHFGLNRLLVNHVIGFLKKHFLIVERNGCLQLGPQVTHIGHNSPFVNRHHSNWRLKALQKMDRTVESDLHYTGPMALSVDAAEKIRSKLIEFVEQATTSASKSESETLMCLNIDWFGY